MVTSCGKTRYPTRAKADAALKHIRSRGFKITVKPQRAYPCTHCNGWQLTSEPR